MKKRKVPLRKCIACSSAKAKEELIRVVRLPDKTVIIDDTGKVSGRGAYICKDIECIDIVNEDNKLSKHLKTTIDEELYKDLKNKI